MAGDDPIFDVFPPTAEGVREWVKTSRRKPLREEVVAYVEGARRDGTMPDAEVQKLAVDYPELAGHG